MALTPGVFDFDWVRGTTSPYIVRLTIDDVAIDYDDVRLSVYNGSTLAFRLTLEDNAGTDPGCVNETEPGVLEFIPTPAQTRMLKKVNVGSVGKSSYELEVRDGLMEWVFLMGTIAGIGGINDDEGVS
jgi:hypothetical protein